MIHALLVSLLLSHNAWGAEPSPPTDLYGLVAFAMERHPEAAAVHADESAARARAEAAGRLMDPQWMVGAQGLGAMPDSMDPTMAMFGVQQMFSLPGVYRAARARAALDVGWAAGERARVAADLKETLWQAAARLRADDAKLDALAGQLAAADAALALGLARYSAGGGVPAAGARGEAVEPGSAAATAPPPVAGARKPSAKAGMAGMAGMAGQGGSAGSGAENGAMGAMGAMGAAATMSGGMSPSMGGEGLAALLRLEAEVARVRAGREALASRRAGEQVRLALLVGAEVAEEVAADPARYLGASAPVGEVPERALSATAVETAAADLRLARVERLPTFMVAADLRVMPDGMVDGVDAAVGVTVPIWGGAGARFDAAAASAVAATRRSEDVDLRLADAVASGRADESAALTRATALRESAAPRARAAWEATIAAWSAGAGSAAEVAAAWQTDVEVARDIADADLAVELARARLARLEGR